MGNDEHGPAYPEPLSDYARYTADLILYDKARARYRCPCCNGDADRYQMCWYAGCPDGRDQIQPPRHPDRITADKAREKERQMNPDKPGCPACILIATLGMLALVGALIFALIRPAHAFDHGYDQSTETYKWFAQLKRQDFMPQPCCGKSDAYEADIYTRNPPSKEEPFGSYDVTITDGSAISFPDGSTRPELPTGAVVHVPGNRINPPKETQGNPTGHSWLFVAYKNIWDPKHSGGNSHTPDFPYCFAPLPEGS